MDEEKKTRKLTWKEILVMALILAVVAAVTARILPKQLEIARERTDVANARAAYMQARDAAADEASPLRQPDGSIQVVIPLKQKQPGWTIDTADVSISGESSLDWTGTPSASGSCTVTYYPETQIITIAWS